MLKKISHYSCEVLKGVGQKLKETLETADIYSLEDLLFHLPIRYQDRTCVTPIMDLLPEQYAVTEGIIMSTQVRYAPKRTLQCMIQDAMGGKLSIRFFHFNAAQAEALQQGKKLRVFGLVRQWRQQLEIIHPEYQCVAKSDILPVEPFLTPIYPKIAALSQKRTRSLMEQALSFLEEASLEDWLPQNVIDGQELMSLQTALVTLHRPEPHLSATMLEDPMHPARMRLAFEELLASRLALRAVQRHKIQFKAPILKGQENVLQAFIKQLPFQLTEAQNRVIETVRSDLNRAYPMRRLLQGDVGSGKTVVAAYTTLIAVSSDMQVALMAPTEILAEQLYTHLQAWFAPLEYTVDFLVGSHGVKKRRECLQALIAGETNVIVGTHALFQEAIVFKTLGLVIIDEQHRFGVKQRLALQNKGQQAGLIPHQLVMTATPIPRSLAMTAYADLDLSIIDHLPPGRIPIKTLVLENGQRQAVIARINHLCGMGQQAYWVCTLVEESEALQCQAAETAFTDLQKALPDLNVGLIHGQMRPDEKEQIMQAFKRAEMDLLVATTVIEVGVNVPNASLMVIENPERLGLAQLHQLRGRVGRGQLASYCVLMYQKPLSKVARKRLEVMRETCDGFKIADEDLRIRGPGDFLGTQQTGLSRFRVADLIKHQSLLPQVKQVAHWMEQQGGYEPEALISRWYRSAKEYAKV
jgi:ATP-dependent DNA helicase RecG